MKYKKLAFYESTYNGNPIGNARVTTGQIVGWEFLRSQSTLDELNSIWNNTPYPGIYILREENVKKVYIGQSNSLYSRVKTHTISPDEKIKNWNIALVISDGRASKLSDFNDNVVRLEIEYYLINLFTANKYKVVAQGSKQSANALQRETVDLFIEELNYFLLKKSLITKLIENDEQKEIMSDELKKILEKKGYKVKKWSAQFADLDDEKYFIRPGSKKTKGWQVTFRDVFKEALFADDGYLLMPRGEVVKIPFNRILTAIDDIDEAKKRNTVDVFIVFDEGSIFLNYKKKTIDISDCKL